MKTLWVVCTASMFWMTSACKSADFSGQSPTKGDSVAEQLPMGTVSPLANQPNTGNLSQVAGVPDNLTPCSTPYSVPATANPYLAGNDANTSITYTIKQGDGPDPVDRMAVDAPVLVAPINQNCIVPGESLYFLVTGFIAYAASQGGADANGFASQEVSHQRGALLGKSDMTAPIASLVGLFLGDGDPSNNPAPTALNFSTDASRDYTTLDPQLGQIFFIGTGKTSSGAFHQIVVPAGATRLYFAVWDGYQWNNNSGSVTGSILVHKN